MNMVRCNGILAPAYFGELNGVVYVFLFRADLETDHRVKDASNNNMPKHEDGGGSYCGGR